MKQHPSPLIKKVAPKLPQLLSFFLPFFIVTISYAIAKVFPFGNQQILASDGWHQYYPFLLTLREKLLTGGSPLRLTRLVATESYPSLRYSNIFGKRDGGSCISASMITT